MRYSMPALLLSAAALAAPALAEEGPGPMVAPPPPEMSAEARQQAGATESAAAAEPADAHGAGVTVRDNPDGSTTIILPGGETLEPEVTIRQKGERTVTEYRVNGRLYMIKVKPAAGPAYYLADTDGDGELESRQSELDPGFLIPKWILFQW